MGYSCRKDAMDGLETIMGETLSNSWIADNGKSCFYEIGRENSDGAITGTVWETDFNNTCRRAGTLRIEPNGSISRWPKANKIMRDRIKSIGE